MLLIRVAIFILVMALSLETLFRYHYYFFGGLFVLLEFAIYIYLLDSFDKSQPRLRSLAIVRNDLLLEFENSERYPNRLVRLIDVESFCPFLSGRYVGFGDRRPYKPNPLGIGIFGHSDELLFYIPIYMENYFEIVRWIASALPLRHAPPILLDKTE